MICECGRDLTLQVLLTKLGNDIELGECESCGIVFIEGYEKEQEKE